MSMKEQNTDYHQKLVKPDFKAVAEALYEFLAGKEDGYEVATRELVDEVFGPGLSEYMGPEVGYVTSYRLFTIVEDDYWEIDKLLMKLVRQKKEFKLDFSKYEGMTVGLPYNIPFVLRKKK